MTIAEKKRYKELAKELLEAINEELTIFKTMYFDDTVKADALIHIDMIEYKEGNIQRLEVERLRLVLFYESYLI